VILRPTREDLTGIEHAWDLRSRRTFRASDFACTDYDFESPTKSLLARKRAVAPEVGGVEVFDYPGRYIQQDQGEEVARVRLQQLRSEAATLSFRTDARGIRAGSILKLEPEDSDGFATEAMVVRTGFRIVNDPGESSDDIELAGESFVCVADAVRSTDQFRPTLAHQKILVEGPQTAEVVGPSGEEIYTDKHGRVKVQFHWDRRGERDHRSSCWIRVSEPWAGKGWGGLQVPRIGQEVIVDFLEGDPDRPIVTGRVYNGANKPPVDLPGGKMISGMRSKTYKGRGSNEITFDDTDGSQRMFINAQYDQVANTNNNRTTTVGIDSTESIGNDTSLDVGNNSLEVVGVDKTVNVGSNTTVSSGSNIVLEAGTSITLRCGASTISMNQAGFITISGTVVTVAGAANCNMTAPLTNVSGGLLMCSGLINMTSGAIMQVNGSATTVRGGPLNLNP
jgi:type VI secretion system secreted protein VgrG